MLPASAVLLRLLRNDLRLIARDPLLVMLSCLVLVLGAVCRFVLPVLDASLAENGIMPSGTTPLRFSDTYPLWVAFIGLWQAALMPGTIFAFLLLDEKEDRTLAAMRVTPVPLRSYLGYRALLPAVLGFVFALVLVPAIGHAPIAPGRLVVLAACACVTAPLTTLLIARFAHDKVQGFALTKFGGVAGLIILFGWFVPEPWQWGLCAFPPFAVAKSFWLAVADTPFWWVPAVLGALAQLLAIGALLRRFAARPPQ